MPATSYFLPAHQAETYPGLPYQMTIAGAWNDHHRCMALVMVSPTLVHGTGSWKLLSSNGL